MNVARRTEKPSNEGHLPPEQRTGEISCWDALDLKTLEAWTESALDPLSETQIDAECIAKIFGVSSLDEIPEFCNQHRRLPNFVILQESEIQNHPATIDREYIGKAYLSFLMNPAGTEYHLVSKEIPETATNYTNIFHMLYRAGVNPMWALKKLLANYASPEEKTEQAHSIESDLYGKKYTSIGIPCKKSSEERATMRSLEAIQVMQTLKTAELDYIYIADDAFLTNAKALGLSQQEAEAAIIETYLFYKALCKQYGLGSIPIYCSSKLKENEWKKSKDIEEKLSRPPYCYLFFPKMWDITPDEYKKSWGLSAKSLEGDEIDALSNLSWYPPFLGKEELAKLNVEELTDEQKALIMMKYTTKSIANIVAAGGTWLAHKFEKGNVKLIKQASKVLKNEAFFLHPDIVEQYGNRVQAIITKYRNFTGKKASNDIRSLLGGSTEALISNEHEDTERIEKECFQIMAIALSAKEINVPKQATAGFLYRELSQLAHTIKKENGDLYKATEKEHPQPKYKTISRHVHYNTYQDIQELLQTQMLPFSTNPTTLKAALARVHRKEVFEFILQNPPARHIDIKDLFLQLDIFFKQVDASHQTLDALWAQDCDDAEFFEYISNFEAHKNILLEELAVYILYYYIWPIEQAILSHSREEIEAVLGIKQTSIASVQEKREHAITQEILDRTQTSSPIMNEPQVGYEIEENLDVFREQVILGIRRSI